MQDEIKDNQIATTTADYGIDEEKLSEGQIQGVQ